MASGKYGSFELTLTKKSSRFGPFQKTKSVQTIDKENKAKALDLLNKPLNEGHLMTNPSTRLFSAMYRLDNAARYTVKIESLDELTLLQYFNNSCASAEASCP